MGAKGDARFEPSADHLFLRTPEGPLLRLLRMTRLMRLLCLLFGLEKMYLTLESGRKYTGSASTSRHGHGVQVVLDYHTAFEIAALLQQPPQIGT